MSSREVTRPIQTGRGESDRRSWLQCLPAYSRSLLKIQVPVTVTLAKSRQPVRNIVDLVPGSILQFNKTCDETLTLEVGNQTVAEGETVKVGDKFGLRVTSIVMPDERFFPVAGPEKPDQK
jgi:flagellar motor switch/type III secretory pathway protein FliN